MRMCRIVAVLLGSLAVPALVVPAWATPVLASPVNASYAVGQGKLMAEATPTVLPTEWTEVSVVTFRGVPPDLPYVISATGGTTDLVPVTWDAVDPKSYVKEGSTFDVHGHTLTDPQQAVIAHVEVYGSPNLVANLSSSSARAGDSMVGHVAGLVPGETAQMWLIHGDEGGAGDFLLGSCRADARGMCTLTATIPKEVPPEVDQWLNVRASLSGTKGLGHFNVVTTPPDCVFLGDLIEPSLKITAVLPMDPQVLTIGKGWVHRAFTAIVRMSDGTTQTRVGLLDPVTADMVSSPGSFTLRGTLVAKFPGENPKGLTLSQEYVVVAQDPTIVGTDVASVVTGVGVEPSLPWVTATLDVQDSHGQPLQSVAPATWDPIDPALYAQVGAFTVHGHTDGPEALPTTARVFVASAGVYPADTKVAAGAQLGLSASGLFSAGGGDAAVYLQSVTGTDRVSAGTVAFAPIQFGQMRARITVPDVPLGDYAVSVVNDAGTAWGLISVVRPAEATNTAAVPLNGCATASPAAPTPTGPAPLPQTGASRMTAPLVGMAGALVAGGVLVLVLRVRASGRPGWRMRHAG